MKKFYLLIATIAIAFFASCEKNSVNNPSENPVYFTKFGFYQQDHAGFLQDSIVFTNLKTTPEINVVLKRGTILDSLKAMTPRFTCSDTSIVVTYGEAGDVVKGDGSDVLDFSMPVDFYLTNGTDYYKYTVTVTVEPNNWDCAAIGTDTLRTNVQVAYDSVNDKFYIMNIRRSSASAKVNPMLFAYSNGQITNVVNTESGALYDAESASSIGLEVATDGTVYAVFGDKGASTSGNATTLSVKNGNVAVVGERGALYKHNISYPVSVFPIGTDIWVAGMQNANQGGIGKRALNLAKYNGSSWTQGEALTGREASSYAYCPKGAIVNGVSYLQVENQQTHTLSMYKNDGTGWKTVFEGLSILRADGNYTSTNNKLSYYHDFAVSANNDIYILAQTQNDNEKYSLTVIKYNATDNTQTIIGGVIPGTQTSSGGLTADLAISPAGTPYVVFEVQDDSSRNFVTYIDNNTKTWVDPEPVTNEESSDYPQIRFDKNGKGHVFTLVNDFLRVYTLK